MTRVQFPARKFFFDLLVYLYACVAGRYNVLRGWGSTAMVHVGISSAEPLKHVANLMVACTHHIRGTLYHTREMPGSSRDGGKRFLLAAQHAHCNRRHGCINEGFQGEDSA